mmetsp:Transcript_7470/g.33182  ORF Transcript_7470/g.33182 Transcript_7470/m.33182 type:complete len:203 (+) Transcript_7470:85-693(+)
MNTYSQLALSFAHLQLVPNYYIYLAQALRGYRAFVTECALRLPSTALFPKLVTPSPSFSFRKPVLLLRSMYPHPRVCSMNRPARNFFRLTNSSAKPVAFSDVPRYSTTYSYNESPKIGTRFEHGHKSSPKRVLGDQTSHWDRSKVISKICITFTSHAEGRVSRNSGRVVSELPVIFRISPWHHFVKSGDILAPNAFCFALML